MLIVSIFFFSYLDVFPWFIKMYPNLYSPAIRFLMVGISRLYHAFQTRVHIQAMQ